MTSQLTRQWTRHLFTLHCFDSQIKYTRGKREGKGKVVCMEKTKKILNRIFIDGLSGMALGLFSTLIIGTIIAQIGTLIGGPVGSYLKAISNVAKTLTGAGIGVGVACKFKEGPLVTVSAAVAGMIGAFPAAPEAITLGAPGEPLGAFVAAYVAIEVGHLVAGKTKVDILVTPLISICAGAAIGLFVGPYITDFMKWLGGLVNVNVEQSPIFGGIIVSVLMGAAVRWLDLQLPATARTR